MTLYDWFAGAEATWIGTFIRESNWIFPFVQCIHLVSLAVLGGAILVVDLSLLGVGLRSSDPALVEKSARPWLNFGLTLAVTTGVLMAMAEALKLYDRQAFFVKMLALGLVVLFAYAVRNPVARRVAPGTMSARAAAIVSIGLWLTVAVSGRWIGFS
jgi:hypothetical protein